MTSEVLTKGKNIFIIKGLEGILLLLILFYFINFWYTLFKPALIIYIACFGMYVLFSRQPDYFDGEINKAVIHFQLDSASKQGKPFAVYSTGGKTYRVKAEYLFTHYSEGEKVDVIYELSQPEKAAIYRWWGYWLSWGEIVFSLVLIIAFYKISHAVTQNPSPESLMDQLNSKPVKRRKYED